MGEESHKKWLKFAKDDLLWTKANIEGKIWYGACFTAQQSVEKALKAYLVSKNQKLRKIHDLVTLLDSCIALDRSFEQFREQCLELTVYYFTTRYPDTIGLLDFTEQRARQAWAFTEQIIEFVEKKLVGGLLSET